jgi:hypothetical protein
MRPCPTSHRVALMSRVAAATTVALVVFGAAGNRAVSVHD